MRRSIGLAMPVMLAVVLGLLLTAGADAAVVTIQPGPVEGIDAHVYSSTDAGGAYSGYNYGAYDYLQIRGDSYNARRMHFFLDFDVSGLAEEDVVSVKFSALSYVYYKYGSASTNREIGLYQVTEAWTEGVSQQPAMDGSITYDNQPTFDPTPVATISVPSTITSAEEAAGGIWHVWDSEDTGNSGFADLVKDWVSGDAENYGMMIRLTAPTSTSGRPYHRYHSSDYGAGIGEDPLLRPKLEISDSGGSPPIPGDANLDNIVNDQDASLLAANWQQTGMGWGDGDFNSDTVVNDADASILAAHWQESQEGAAPVPEPGTLILLAGALLSLLVWRRR